MADNSVFNFNSQDYTFQVRIYNGENDIQLRPEGFDRLYLEESIFDWWISGSIEIKTPYDSFERSSDEVAFIAPDQKKVIYKFRNDGRDTIFISIIPKQADLGISVGEFAEEKWRIELEAVIYDVQDIQHTNMTNKIKKLFFHEKTYQMMLEKNIEFTTANVGDNKNKTNIHKLNNEDRSLPSGQALGELLKADTDFAKFATLVDDSTMWSKGSDKSKLFYSSPTNSRFIDDLNYLNSHHVASEEDLFQPCILKLERKGAGKPKQFSLLSMKKYFEKAGKSEPGDYQIEHIFLEEGSQTNSANETVISKAPLSKSNTLDKDVKARDFTNTSNYQLVDMSGRDYSTKLANIGIISFNSAKGQFNIESSMHKSETYKDFYKQNVVPGVLTSQASDRLPVTNYISKGYNMHYHYSVRSNDKQRLAEGRNTILQHYLFSNLGISMTLRGLTHRQPGRFFGLSKQSMNAEEHDHKVEGQYLTTSVIHYFSPTDRSYYTSIVGVKVHTYKELNPLQDGEDAMIQDTSGDTNTD